MKDAHTFHHLPHPHLFTCMPSYPPPHSLPPPHPHHLHTHIPPPHTLTTSTHPHHFHTPSPPPHTPSPPHTLTTSTHPHHLLTSTHSHYLHTHTQTSTISAFNCFLCSSRVMSSSCCTLITTVCTRMGTHAPSSTLYSTVTLEEGRGGRGDRGGRRGDRGGRKGEGEGGGRRREGEGGEIQTLYSKQETRIYVPRNLGICAISRLRSTFSESRKLRANLEIAQTILRLRATFAQSRDCANVRIAQSSNF